MKARSAIYTGFILLICIFGSGLSRGETTIGTLFQNAMEQAGQVSRAESIKAFEEIISREIETMDKTEIDLQSGQTGQIAAEDLQTGQSQDGDVLDSVFPDSDIWGETRVYTSGGQVHHIAAEDLKIKRSQDGDLTRTVTANYEGNREDDFTYLQIDVNQVPEGIYQLTVLAKDKRTEQTDRKYVYFRIVE